MLFHRQHRTMMEHISWHFFCFRNPEQHWLSVEDRRLSTWLSQCSSNLSDPPVRGGDTSIRIINNSSVHSIWDITTAAHRNARAHCVTNPRFVNGSLTLSSTMSDDRGVTIFVNSNYSLQSSLLSFSSFPAYCLKLMSIESFKTYPKLFTNSATFPQFYWIIGTSNTVENKVTKTQTYQELRKKRILRENIKYAIPLNVSKGLVYHNTDRYWTKCILATHIIKLRTEKKGSERFANSNQYVRVQVSLGQKRNDNDPEANSRSFGAWVSLLKAEIKRNDENNQSHRRFHCLFHRSIVGDVVPQDREVPY